MTKTRRKEIEDTAETYATGNHSVSFPDTHYKKAFITGAEWADENLQTVDLNNKKVIYTKNKTFVDGDYVLILESKLNTTIRALNYFKDLLKPEYDHYLTSDVRKLIDDKCNKILEEIKS